MIQDGLDRKQLNGKARVNFITTIAESIFCYKAFLTKEKCEDVAKEILKKWSFLGVSDGYSESSVLYAQ